MFPLCVASALPGKFADVCNLADSFLCADERSGGSPSTAVRPDENVSDSGNMFPADAELQFEVDRSTFIRAQNSDLCLAKCVEAAASPVPYVPRVYFL